MLLLLGYLTIGFALMVWVISYFGPPDNKEDWRKSVLAIFLWPLVAYSLIKYREQLFNNKSSSNEDNKN